MSDPRDAEIVRLRQHVRSLHRLNGYSKSKGWWCSCGSWWAREVRFMPAPWERRAEAEALHSHHVNEMTGAAQ